MIDNIAGHDYEIGLLSVDCVEGSSVRLFVSVKICAGENLHWLPQRTKSLSFL
jgi:hypothetical protein